MLPLKLKMSAFCSYLEETEIDFTKFGAKGLYLITGDTGAGKTTIFDAICYALFNQASGNNRDVKLLRSKNATPDIQTYVELTFMSKGKKYTVYRSPEYERYSLRGNKTTTNKATLKITYYNGDETRIEELKSGDKVIEDIISISAEKFKKLSMIAQGEFMRVLNASPQDKTEMLRTIFSTENFDLMQKELKTRTDECKSRCDIETHKLIAQLQRSSCSESSPYSEELIKLKDINSSFVTGADKVSELLTKILEEDSLKLSKLKEESKNTDELIEKKRSEIGQARERENTRKIYLDTKAKLEAGEKLLPLLEAAFAAVEKNEEKASALDGEIKLLKEKIPEYKKLEVLRTELSAAEKIISACAKEAAENKLHYEKTVKQTAELRAELEKYKDSAAALEKLKAENDRRNEVIIKYREYRKEIMSYTVSIRELEKLRKEYIKAKIDNQEKSRIYTEMNNAFLDEQAGIIAETLAEGKPCPVCGSIEHPHIAVKHPGAPTKAQVNNARKAADEASELASKASAACSSASAVCDQKKETAEKISAELFGEQRSPEMLIAALDEKGISLRKEIEKADLEIGDLKKQCSRKQEIELRLPALERSAEDTRTALEKMRTETAVTEQKKAGLLQQVKETEASLPCTTKALLDRRIAELESGRLKLISAFKTADKNLSECRAAVREKKETLDRFRNISLKDEREEIEKTEKETAALKIENDIRNESISILRMRIASNSEIQNYIDNNYTGLTKLHDYYTQLKEISDTANGTLIGREKMTLEVFAQTKYFDSILSFANLRLRKMSSGKYEFKRSEAALDKKSKSGLDIDVIDHDSATRRSVKSLSGGESFMASLSLALGFSDVIQSNIGGIHLETMFIDEGFGTLDDKALENAYRVFSDLSNDGSCLVGIISHVEDLKTRITNRIVVTKDACGNSHAKIETELQ